MRLYYGYEAPSGSGLFIPYESLGNGPSFESLPLEEARPVEPSSARLEEWVDSRFRFGIMTRPIGADPVAAVATELYGELFEASRDAHLYRIWNYLPRINQGEGDEETYRQYCLGRSKAFAARFGAAAERRMPAGSCLGRDDDTLVVCFLAGAAPPVHHENPKQLPAYRYPPQYGPLPPSFARATTVATSDGGKFLFVSGTSSVVGHESVGGGDLASQLRVTGENLEIVARQALSRAGISFGSKIRSGKVYLRNRDDYSEAKAFFDERFPAWSASLVYLRADICRRELLVEAELALYDRGV